MAIMATVGSEYEKAPEGQHRAICVYVQDLGMVTTTWENETRSQHKIKIWWQVDERDSRGERHLVGRRFTLSLHPKSALRPFLESWRGQKYPEDVREVDLEKMTGVPGLIQVVHENGYANVDSIMKTPKGMEPLTAEPIESPPWERRREESGPGMPGGDQPEDDDDLPF